MKAQELLLTRQSTSVLTTPAPDQSELEVILNAGMRVPDHGGLTPWYFTVVQNDGLKKLSNIFKEAAIKVNKSEVMIDKASKMPNRSPLILIVSTNYKANDKVPESEQLIAAGCCVHAMQMAAFSLGYGAIWRTGDLCYDDTVKSALNVSENNDIVGFLYIGSLVKKTVTKTRKGFETHVNYL